MALRVILTICGLTFVNFITVAAEEQSESQQNCDAENVEVCVDEAVQAFGEAGRADAQGRMEEFEEKMDIVRAKLRIACNANHARACHLLGNHTDDDTERDAAYKKGLVLAKTQCDGGDAEACRQLGLMYARGRGTERDQAEARAYYLLACDGGSVSGCAALAQLYEYGIGVAKNEAKASEYYQKACELGASRHCDK